MLRDRGHQLWIWTEFKAQKSTLVHGFTQRDYTLGNNNHFNYTSGEKKNWGKSNGQFWQYFQNRSLEQYERPFDLWCQLGNQHTAVLNLTLISFVGIHVSLLLFALLTYLKVEELRTLNLEATTRYKIRTAGIFLKFDRATLKAGMTERRKDGTAEWRNHGTAENHPKS